MAVQSVKTIGQLNDLVNHKWLAQLSKAYEEEMNRFSGFTTEIVVNTEAANLVLNDYLPYLKQIGINERPQYESILGKTINYSISRYSQGLHMSKTNFSDVSAQVLLNTQLPQLATNVATLRTERIVEILVNGDTSDDFITYDGKRLFANDHDINGNTFDNLQAGALTGANIQAGKDILRQVPIRADGKWMPTGNAKFYVITGENREIEIREILDSSKIAQDNRFNDNPYKNIAQWISSSHIQDTNDWYLVMTLPGLSPFVTVRHSTSKRGLTSFVDDNDRFVAETNRYSWLIDVMEQTYPVYFWQMVKFVNA